MSSELWPNRDGTKGRADGGGGDGIGGWAEGRADRSWEHRGGALPRFRQDYNTERPHLALGWIPPLNRLAAMNNVRVNDT